MDPLLPTSKPLHDKVGWQFPLNPLSPLLNYINPVMPVVVQSSRYDNQDIIVSVSLCQFGLASYSKVQLLVSPPYGLADIKIDKN